MTNDVTYSMCVKNVSCRTVVRVLKNKVRQNSTLRGWILAKSMTKPRLQNSMINNSTRKKVFLNAIQKNGRRVFSLILSISPKIFIKSSVLASKITKSIKFLASGEIDLGWFLRTLTEANATLHQCCALRAASHRERVGSQATCRAWGIGSPPLWRTQYLFHSGWKS